MLTDPCLGLHVRLCPNVCNKPDTSAASVTGVQPLPQQAMTADAVICIASPATLSTAFLAFQLDANADLVAQCMLCCTLKAQNLLVQAAFGCVTVCAVVQMSTCQIFT